LAELESELEEKKKHPPTIVHGKTDSQGILLPTVHLETKAPPPRVPPPHVHSPIPPTARPPKPTPPKPTPQEAAVKAAQARAVVLKQQREARAAALQKHLAHRQTGVWHGLNIHAYTQQVNQIVSRYIPELKAKYGEIVGEAEFETIMQEMEKTYGPKVTYSNLRKVYQKGWIRDPQVSGINSAVLLKAVWTLVKDKGEESMYKHFSETLDEIGATCIQGCSHRLFIDYVALTEDEKTTSV
jgi:hypothetical protein